MRSILLFFFKCTHSTQKSSQERPWEEDDWILEIKRGVLELIQNGEQEVTLNMHLIETIRMGDACRAKFSSASLENM
uniref:Uncharacterized protein n=1 Tax=Mola mola TaxID=94237 RepID=A0A3Q3W262_MOLML